MCLPLTFMLLNYCTCWGDSVFFNTPNVCCYQSSPHPYCRFFQQRSWHNDEINARIERIEADSSEVEEDEGLYATYAMLHTYRNE